MRDIETNDSELRLVAVRLAARKRSGPTGMHSIVLCVGFLTGGLRLTAVLISGLPVLVSGPTVSLGEIVGQRFRGRLMFFSEQLMHKGYFILALGCRAEGFRGRVVGLLGLVVGGP
jgi:hypothetical protein